MSTNINEGNKVISEDKIREIIENIDIEEIEGKKDVYIKVEQKKTDFYERITRQVKNVCEKLEVSSVNYNKILETSKIIEVDIPLLLESKIGNREIIKVVTSFLVQHNNICGPFAYEINFLPQLTLDDVKGLSILSTLRNSLFELPFGGASAGLSLNSYMLSKKENERIAKSYIKTMNRFIDFDREIISSGYGVNEEFISFLYKEWKKIKKKNNLKENFLGKRFQDGGVRARERMRAFVILTLLEELLKLEEVNKLPGINKHEEIIKQSRQEKKVVFCGFNETEQELAFLLYNRGYKILAICDELGCIVSTQGIDPREAARCKKLRKSVIQTKKYMKIRKEDAIKINTDILVLGSIIEKVNSDEIRKIKAPIILEITAIFDNMCYNLLGEMKKNVLPYIVAGCNRILPNYLEWLQNKEERFFSEREIEAKIEEKIRSVMLEINNEVRKHNVGFSDACFILAVKKFLSHLKGKRIKNFQTS